ncbi:hypothetical protein [Streptomyces sp. NPDC002054]|uniref:hypothetical protein n=1 Tax=Streptomyces sp. NPDC002054 TaxID=3154663 RepID=UPI003320795A
MVVDQPLRVCSPTVVLSVSLHGRDSGYPVVTLRQDLLAIRRATGRPHVTLALPPELDVQPFLAELRQPRTAVSTVSRPL